MTISSANAHPTNPAFYKDVVKTHIIQPLVKSIPSKLENTDNFPKIIEKATNKALKNVANLTGIPLDTLSDIAQEIFSRLPRDKKGKSSIMPDKSRIMTFKQRISLLTDVLVEKLEEAHVVSQYDIILDKSLKVSDGVMLKSPLAKGSLTPEDKPSVEGQKEDDDYFVIPNQPNVMLVEAKYNIATQDIITTFSDKIQALKSVSQDKLVNIFQKVTNSLFIEYNELSSENNEGLMAKLNTMIDNILPKTSFGVAMGLHEKQEVTDFLNKLKSNDFKDELTKALKKADEENDFELV